MPTKANATNITYPSSPQSDTETTSGTSAQARAASLMAGHSHLVILFHSQLVHGVFGSKCAEGISVAWSVRWICVASRKELTCVTSLSLDFFAWFPASHIVFLLLLSWILLTLAAIAHRCFWQSEFSSLIKAIERTALLLPYASSCFLTDMIDVHTLRMRRKGFLEMGLIQEMGIR